MRPYSNENRQSVGGVIDFEEMCLVLCRSDAIDCEYCLLRGSTARECSQRKSVLEAEMLEAVREELEVRK